MFWGLTAHGVNRNQDTFVVTTLFGVNAAVPGVQYGAPRAYGLSVGTTHIIRRCVVASEAKLIEFWLPTPWSEMTARSL